MAINALQSAASALSALNTSLDVTSNNLANVNTSGFKASRTNFQDLLYVEKVQPGTENALGQRNPTGLYVGLGVKVSGTQLDFTPGSPQQTGRELDLSIDGQGFFRVQVEDNLGAVAYTRAGNFALNQDGELVLANDTGRRLEPNIVIPPEATEVAVDSSGKVFVMLADGNTEPTQVGQLELTTFINPAGLEQIGQNLYRETVASGTPVNGNPGEQNRGRIKQGMLESSNVDPTRELIDMIKTQRAFEMNSNSIKAADETLRNVAALRR